MRNVVIRAVPKEPDEAQRRERLLALLATGLERLVSRDTASTETTRPVDFYP